MTTTALTEIAEQELFTVSELREKEHARLDLVALKAKTALDIEIVDKKTYEAVHEAQMECQRNRTRISKGRLAFTEILTIQTKDAIRVEKEMIAIIEPTEQALKAKKIAYDTEQARIKAEQEAQAMRILEERNNELLSYGVTVPLDTLKNMTEDGFRPMADMWKKKWEESERVRLEQESEKARQEAEAEKKRQDELEEMRRIQEANRVESERLRVENERIAESNRKQAEELAQKQKMIDDKENEIKRQEELKQAQESARLQAIEDEKTRVESERLRKIAEDQVEKAKLEAEQWFKNWLIENGVTPENKDQFEVRNSESGKVLWKKIAIYNP